MKEGTHHSHMLGLDTDRHQDLSNADTSCCAVGLAISSTHTGLQPISTGTRKHFVDAQDGEGVHPHADVVCLFTGVLDQVLVASHTSCLKSL